MRGSRRRPETRSRPARSAANGRCFGRWSRRCAAEYALPALRIEKKTAGARPSIRHNGSDSTSAVVRGARAQASRRSARLPSTDGTRPSRATGRAPTICLRAPGSHCDIGRDARIAFTEHGRSSSRIVRRRRFQLLEPREMLAIEEFVSGQEGIVQPALALVGVDRPPAQPMHPPPPASAYARACLLQKVQQQAPARSHRRAFAPAPGRMR